MYLVFGRPEPVRAMLTPAAGFARILIPPQIPTGRS